jgi:hypothetical protein
MSVAGKGKRTRKPSMPKIRVPVAPPGRSIPSPKDYDRKREREDARREVEQETDDE